MLSVACINAELLQLDLAGERVDMLGDLNHALDRATELARRTLRLAYAEPVAPTAVNVGELADTLGLVAARLLGPDIAYTLLADGDAWIVADASQIERVLLNLLVNSRDATRRGGRVAVTVSQRRLVAPKQYAHDIVPVGRWVCLQVADTGHGISPQLLPRMFEERVTTNGDDAHGCGLASVLGIVRTWRGHVLVESTAHVGASVTCYFPAMPVAE